jgi:hypothetical protein
VGGLFVAGAVITLIQFVRLRDRRLLPLAVLLLCFAGAEARESWEQPVRRRFQAGALAAGVALLAMISIDAAARAERR